MKLINKWLAKERELSDEDCQKLDEIHQEISSILENKAFFGTFDKDIYNHIEDLEYELQRLWGFEQNCAYHRHKHEYEFRCQWVGRKFRCNTTGMVFEIPKDVKERDFLSFGEAYLDVGRLNLYSRFSNCTEITEEIE